MWFERKKMWLVLIINGWFFSLIFHPLKNCFYFQIELTNDLLSISSKKRFCKVGEKNMKIWRFINNVERNEKNLTAYSWQYYFFIFLLLLFRESWDCKYERHTFSRFVVFFFRSSCCIRLLSKHQHFSLQ